MKKKFLSFVLAICLILPCAFALSACGKNPPDEPTGLAGKTIHCSAFNEEFDSGMGGKEDRVLVATTKNGKVTADNVYNANVTISSKGRADLTFNEVLGENNIVGANGEVNVKVSKDAVYTLKTSSEKGKVDVNLAQLPVGGYQERTEKVTHVNTSSESSNKINISTKSGQLKLSDY